MLDEASDRTRRVLDRSLAVGCVNVIKLNVVGHEPPETLVKFLLEPRRRRVFDLFQIGVPMQAAFRGDDHLIAAVAECLGDEPFALAIGPITIGRVEKVDAHVKAGGDRRQAVSVVHAGTSHAGDGPASQSDGRHLEIGLA